MRILYVEDNPQDAELARIELARALPDWELCTVATLEEAWTRLDEVLDFDGVVADLNLPDGSGLDLVVGVRERELPIALVMLTGSGDERSAVAALKAGVDDYLQKRGDYLRRLPGVLEAAVASFQAGLARRSRPLRVLFAEHVLADAELTRRHLERHAAYIRLEVVATAAEARQRLAEEPGVYDVLLLDHRLADMSAMDLLRNLRSDGGTRIPVVLITGQGDEAVAVEAIRLGVSDYIVKRPGFLQEIPATLENAFHRAQLARERAALRASEASRRLREEALEAMPMGVVLADEDRRVVYANPAFARITGYPTELVIGRSCRILQGPGTAAAEARRMRRALVEGLPYEGELLNYRRDGTSFWNHLSITPVRDEDGHVVNYIGVQLDVTERRRTEEALRASEESFRQIAENIHEVFWITDPERRAVLYVSPAYERIWGRTCAALLADPNDWFEGVHPEDRERVRAASASGSGGDYQETYRIVRPDGETRWVHDRGYAIRDAAGRVHRVVGTAEDVTEKRLLEAQFLQAQKMEAIGTLAGGIAHDFNNILAAINGYTELLQISLQGAGAPVDAHLHALGKATARAAALVRQILTFSRPGRHERRTLDLARAVEEPLALLRASLPATIAFDVRLEPDLPPVLADATQVHQVLMNLGANAGHAMGERPGRLGVRLDWVEVAAEQAGADGRPRPGPHVRLTVSDTGCGMPTKILDRVFEPFFTTKAPGEGTGLGLSVVHGVMQAHEGSVTVRSTAGQGTVFELLFPVHAPRREDRAAGEPGPLPRGRGERVLVVDDEAPVLQVGKLMLDQLGYAVEICQDSGSALRRIRAAPGEIDLLLSDVAMPGMAGPDLVEQARRLRPELPVLLMTGYQAGLAPERLRLLGVGEVVAKPFSVRSLGLAVRRALDQAAERSGRAPASG